MKSFAGMRIAITGASAGIGRALAVDLARRGVRLALAARNHDALDEVCRDCAAIGGEAVAVPTDVGDPASCKAFVDAAAERLGGLDVLVNNAGISMWARFEEVTDLSIFERLMRVNYLGAVHCTYHALPHLRRSRGLLVAVSSLTGKQGVPTRSGYAASKHAVQGFFDTLRIELRGSGVDVLVVSPGFVQTEIRARALGPDGKPLEKSPRREDRGTMTLDECTRRMIEAMAQRRRELVMSAPARAGLWLKLVAPSLVDRFAEAAVRPRRR